MMLPIPTNRSLSYSDAENAPAIKVDDNIQLHFINEVMAGTGDIILSNGSDTRRIAITDTSQVTFSSSKLAGNSVIINPAQDLIPNTHYNIQMASGVIQDMAGNVNASIDDPETLSFNTTDSAPLLEASNVGTNSWGWNLPAELAADDNIWLNFDEAIIAGTGSIIISNGADTRVIDIHDDSQVTFNSDSTGSIMINPAADLIPNASYHIRIAPGAITDTTGNAYAGIADPATLNFTTTSANPVLWWSNSWHGSTVKADDDIRLYFNETVKAGNGHIMISNGSDTRSININDTNQVTFDRFNSVTINPTLDLIPNSAYTILMSAGVITDISGHAFAGVNDPVTLDFTATSSAPMLTGISPVNSFAPMDKVIVKADDGITLQFDEKVTAGSGNIVISNGADTRIIDIHDSTQVTFGDYGEVFIKPMQHWILNTPYTVQLPDGVINDAGGNAFAGSSDPSGFSFTPVDSSPMLVSTNFTSIDNQPFLSASQLWSEPLALRADYVLQLHFDEVVTAGSGSIIISNGLDKRKIDIHDASQVTFYDYGDVIIDPAQNLMPHATYRIELERGVITDTAGNPYAGLHDETALEFTTTDPYFIPMTGVDSSNLTAL